MGVHLRQDGFRVFLVEFLQEVDALVALHLIEDERRLFDGKIFQEVGALHIGQFLNQVGSIFRLEQGEDARLRLVIQPGDGPGDVGRVQLLQVLIEIRGVLSGDDVLDFLPRLSDDVVGHSRAPLVSA